MVYISKEKPYELGKEYQGLTPEELLNIEPKFRNPNELPHEALTDPDYHLNQLEKNFNNGEFKLDMKCSKCHHCR